MNIKINKTTIIKKISISFITLLLLLNTFVLGVIADEEANNVVGEFKKVTSNESKIDCFIVPTDEELMISIDTYELVK